MDPGTILAVISLAHLVIQAPKQLYDFCSNAKDAPTEFEKISKHLEISRQQLKRIPDELPDDEDRELAAETIQTCRDELECLQAFANKVAPNDRGSRWNKVRSSVKAALQEPQLAKRRENLDRAQQSLSLHLLYRLMGDNKKIIQKLEDSDRKQFDARIAFESRIVEVIDTLQLDINEKACSFLASGLEPMIREAICETFRPIVLERMHSRSLVTAQKSSLEHPMEWSESGTVMSGKISDYVPSPEPAIKRYTYSHNALSRPALKKTTLERHDGQYSTWLANFFYRSRLVRVQTVDVADESSSGGNSNSEARCEVETTFTVFPRWWLGSTGISLSYVRTGSGWLPNLNLRPCIVKPHDALIFKFCATGNLMAVKELLSRKEASPFDTDPDGWTPLHCAAQAHHYEICKLLINEGASANAVDLENVSPLHVALSRRTGRLPFSSIEFQRPQAAGDEVPRLMRLLVSVGRSDPSIENHTNGENCYDLITSNISTWGTNLLLWLYRQTTFDVDPDHRDRYGRTALMKADFMLAATDADLDALIYLGIDINAKIEPTPVSDALWEDGSTSLHMAVVQLAIVHMTLDTPDPERLAVRKNRLKYLLSRGADPHALSDRGETPTDLCLRWGKHRIFNVWREVILDMGYSARDFVRREIDLHAHMPWYVMNWCDYRLVALFELDDGFEDGFTEIEPSELFSMRDRMFTARERARMRATTEDDDDGNDLLASLGDLIPDEPPETIMEERRELLMVYKSPKPGKEEDIWKGNREFGKPFVNSVNNFFTVEPYEQAEQNQTRY